MAKTTCSERTKSSDGHRHRCFGTSPTAASGPGCQLHMRSIDGCLPSPAFIRKGCFVRPVSDLAISALRSGPTEHQGSAKCIKIIGNNRSSVPQSGVRQTGRTPAIGSLFSRTPPMPPLLPWLVTGGPMARPASLPTGLEAHNGLAIRTHPFFTADGKLSASRFRSPHWPPLGASSPCPFTVPHVA